MRLLIQRVLHARVLVAPSAAASSSSCASTSPNLNVIDAVRTSQHSDSSGTSGESSLVTVGSTNGPGLLVFVGISRNDGPIEAAWAVRKMLNIRLFPESKREERSACGSSVAEVEEKPWSRNIMQIGGGLLIVSQFTLCAQMKGNKPDFHTAMSPAPAREYFDSLVRAARTGYKNHPERIQEGVFGAHMHVDLINDGPVTLDLESPPRAQSAPPGKPISTRNDSDVRNSNASGTEAAGKSHSENEEQ